MKLCNHSVRRPRGRAGVLLLLSCLAANAPRAALAIESVPAAADGSVALAEEKAARAFEAYQGKRFAEAVGLYLEAHEVAPNADILYNIARIYDTKLGDRPLAISFYRRYITDPGAIAERIQLANERLLTLREAELAVTRPVAAPAAGLPTPVVAAGAPAAREPGWTTSQLAGALLATTGVVALGVGVGYGLAAVRETQTARDLCDGNVCREQGGIDAAERATDHARWSTIGFASGGALVALGAVCYFWLGGEATERPLQASAAGLQLAAGFSAHAGGGSLELAGAW